MEQQSSTGKKINRTTSYILILVFIAPMVGAWIIFNYFPDLVKTMGTTNHGTFVYPVRPVELTGLQTSNAQKITQQYFKDKWTIVYIDQAPCDEACRLNIIKAHQVKLAQGPEMDRVQQMVVMLGKDDLASLGKTLDAGKEFTLIQQDQAHLAGFLKVFTLKDGKAPGQARRIYLVDPLGQLMMYYEFDHQDKAMKRENGMRRDLKKLLKDSKIG